MQGLPEGTRGAYRGTHRRNGWWPGAGTRRQGGAGRAPAGPVTARESAEEPPTTVLHLDRQSADEPQTQVLHLRQPAGEPPTEVLHLDSLPGGGRSAARGRSDAA